MLNNKKQTQMLVADNNSIELGARILNNGGLVVFPTETVYGIGANALDADAVRKIFVAKGRPQDNPLIVHISSIEEIKPLILDFPEKAKKLADAFWPGPLTMVLQKSDIIPDIISAGLGTVAVRLPSHPTALDLIKRAGVPVAAPSANRSGRPSPTTAQHCYMDLAGRVELILDGGPSDVGVESTVISMVSHPPTLLRPGKISPEEIESVIGEISITNGVFKELDEGECVLSPGLKHKHYSPKAKVVLVHGSIEQFAKYCLENYSEKMWAMAFTEDMGSLEIPAVSYGGLESPQEQAAQLFSKLRELDDLGAKSVYVHAPSSKGIGLAVYNRLLRAASFKEEHL